jgi:alpha-L-fucosidase
MIPRRDFVTLATLGIGAPLARLPRLSRLSSPRPRPTPSQLTWQRDELALFLHFGVNTFTDREWGDGRESPSQFAPTALDCRQWARTARNAGFKAMVLTAKHHDGFCLWPTATTRHSVASSPWRNGQGDLVREFVDACRTEGLRVGLYCSPWDRNSPAYGDSPRYNALFQQQLTELLTRYGPIHEVWFDGANGEGPNGRRQVYDWPATFGLVRRLQPDAVIFSDAGPDVRWIGNERGSAGDPNWSTIDPAAVPYPGIDAPGVIEALQHGHPHGTVWRPGETDTSIRPGWFYHPAEDGRVRGPDELVDLYFTSVGRNSKLLLNVPPTRAGLLHSTDVQNLLEMRRRLDAKFARDLTAGRHPSWRSIGGSRGEWWIDLGQRTRISTLDLRERIEEGQRVSRYRVEGHDGTRWQLLSTGATIGYRKLDRIVPRRVRQVRVQVLEGIEAPLPLTIGLYDS